MEEFRVPQAVGREKCERLKQNDHVDTLKAFCESESYWCLKKFWTQLYLSILCKYSEEMNFDNKQLYG